MVYRLYDIQTECFVDSCSSIDRDECIWNGLNWLTEDWDYDELTSMFSNFSTAETVLNNFDLEIRES